MAKAHTFIGSDASRARKLAARPRKPKFALGEVVIDPHGDIGAIDAIYADLLAVEEAGVIDDVKDWLVGSSSTLCRAGKEAQDAQRWHLVLARLRTWRRCVR